MFNASEAVRGLPTAKTFVVGELLFAQFTCAGDTALWTQTDCMVHILTAEKTWRTLGGTWTANAGETVFFKKGAYVFPAPIAREPCIFVFFIPDTFVREVVRDLTADLPLLAGHSELSEPFIRVNQDVGLSAFLQAMNVYFAGKEKPAAPLLQLKLWELVTSVLVGAANPMLSAHFRSVAICEAPSIPAIMEANFHHNLPLEVFARMCHRSLSTFKRDFQSHYGESPGRWLLQRRLDCAANLLRTTNLNVTEAMLECGFENASHFGRAFKAKLGQSPSDFREGISLGTSRAV
jgi:AraC family transcriptional regulator, exoenzyme S synthesis regulatory protein ExsA